eukprot:287039-Prymnesium_polylepis.1
MRSCHPKYRSIMPAVVPVSDRYRRAVVSASRRNECVGHFGSSPALKSRSGSGLRGSEFAFT